MLHAGVLKKFGLYGLLRLAIPMLPEGARHWATLLVVLLLGNIIYVGLVTIAQSRLDWMLGYSSVMHMGYIFLGIASFSLLGITGAVLIMIQAHVLDADLPLAVEILTDLVRRPLLRESDLESERNVILEEINGVADTPDDLVFELHAEALWPNHPYGYSILGKPETLEALSSDDLRALHRAGYYRGNCVIAAAGNVSHDQLITVLEREGWFEGVTREVPRSGVIPVPAVRGADCTEHRDTSQTHIVFGTDTFPLRDPRRFPIAILTNVFGGGMSSRLFVELRDKRSLAYSVTSFSMEGLDPAGLRALADQLRPCWPVLAEGSAPAAGGNRNDPMGPHDASVGVQRQIVRRHRPGGRAEEFRHRDSTDHTLLLQPGHG